MALSDANSKTALGAVPNGWDVLPLGDLLTFQNGVNADKGAYGRGVRFANVLEVITHTHLRAKQIPGRVTLPPQARRSCAVRAGNVLFNRTSETQEELGLAAVYTDSEEIVFGGFVIRGQLRSDKLNPTYAGYGLRAPSVRSQIMAKGQGAIRANIGQSQLSTVLIALPPAAEQEAIAEALSDADALIESLEQLIAKKRLIKQGAMQELLTGKRRLPGFEKRRGTKQTDAGEIPRDWETRPFSETACITAGQVSPRVEPYRSMVLVAPNHVESGTGRLLERVSAAEQGAVSGKYHFKRGHVVYSKIRPYLMKAILADFDGLCSADMYPLAAAEDVSPRFLLALLLGRRFTQFAEEVSMRTGIPKLNREELAQFVFVLPPQDEQVAIATILADMDSELAALEAKLEKARMIKQGMMHNLLTGKIRLV